MIGIGVKRTSGGGAVSPFPASPNGIDKLILAMDGWKTNGVSTITPSIVMSRTGNGTDNPELWVAPCQVTFDALATTDTATADTFADLLYYWDYGDSAQENVYWTYGAQPGTQSKNHDTGPIGGHVYTVHGTYTVTLWVMNSAGDIAKLTQQITVSDPDVVFAGNKTVCISISGDFTGAPADALKVTKGAGGTTYPGSAPASNTRYLYKSGETFLAGTDALHLLNVSNVQIGSFGGTVKPIFQKSASGSTVRVRSNNGITDNIQVFGIKFTNPDRYTGGIAVAMSTASTSGTGTGTNLNSILDVRGHVLAYDLEVDGLVPVSLNGNGCAAVDVVCPDAFNGASGAVGFWGMNVYHCMWAGNYVDVKGDVNVNAPATEHCMRIQGGRACYIAHNRLKNPKATKHCLTIRGSSVSTPGQVIDAWTPDTVTYYGSLRVPTVANGFIYRTSERSGTFKTGATEPTWPTAIGQTVVDNEITWTCEYVDTTTTTLTAIPAYYVSNYYNVFDNFYDMETSVANINYITAFHPSNDQGHEVIDSIIHRGNYYSPYPSVTSSSRYACFIRASNVIFQNNIMNFGEAKADITGALIVGSDASGIPLPHGLRFDNNTYYSSYHSVDYNDVHVCVDFAAGALSTGNTARNNLMYAPFGLAVTVVKDPSAVATVSNNSTDLQAVNDNPFDTASPLTAADFKLSATSYAKGAGADIDGGFLDFHGTVRDRRAIDMGAISKDS